MENLEADAMKATEVAIELELREFGAKFDGVAASPL